MSETQVGARAVPATMQALCANAENMEARARLRLARVVRRRFGLGNVPAAIVLEWAAAGGECETLDVGREEQPWLFG